MKSTSWFADQADHFGRLALVARRIGPGRAAVLVTGRRARLGGDSLSCVVDRFSCADGVFRVSGRLRTGLAVVGVGLRLPHRQWGWVETVLPVGAGGDEDAELPFAFSVPAGDVSAPLRWVLRVALADGSWCELPDIHRVALGHEAFARLVPAFLRALGDRPAGTMVEIGGRDRSGSGTYRSLVPAGWKYVAFDIVDAPGVDVVGDAHDLSSYFEAGSVGAIVSASTFEHLAMPWKVAIEMNRVLRTGGLVFASTHQAWPLHEEPWDYWRFSDHSWPALFNEATGFQVEETAMGQPADVVARIMNGATAGLPGQPVYLGSGVIASKIGKTALSWPVATNLVTKESYPR